MGKLPSERVAVCAVVDPDAYTAATTYSRTSGWVDMQEYHTAMAVVFVGDLGASGTVDAKLQQATSATGAGAKDITSKAITALTTTTAASGDSNKQAVIDLLTDELDVANGFRWVRLAIRSQTSTGDLGGIVLGLDPRYGPATNNDASTVDEIVN